MSVESSNREEEISSIINHILSAEPELLDKVTSRSDSLLLEADPEEDWDLFKQAVRVAVDDVTGEKSDNISFDESGKTAVVQLSQ